MATGEPLLPGHANQNKQGPSTQSKQMLTIVTSLYVSYTSAGALRHGLSDAMTELISVGRVS